MDYDRQADREQAARDAALGRRMKSLRAGHMGPVLKRWVNADVTPVADLIRKAAVAYLEGDMEEVGRLLDTPTAELATRERPLAALLEWTLRGSSPGRAGEETTHADDLALAFLSTAVTSLSRTEAFASYLFLQTAVTLKETVLGQFITGIQGASAMQAVRERNPELWQQKKSLSRICARLASQVKPQLDREEGELRLGARKAVTVLDYKGRERRLSLKVPDGVAWEVMTLCWRDEGAGTTTDPYRSIWLAFAGMFFAAAQKCSGWFDIAEKRQRHGRHVRKNKVLVLSAKAREALDRDADKWVQSGFSREPMVVPPENGDYLTVKHRQVTGQRAPLGMQTDPKETTAWITGACALASTPWTVNAFALGGLDPSEGTAPNDILKIAEHRRLAAEPALYLPVTMDFRGRIYYQPSWVTPQSGDLGKSLLRFPLDPEKSLSEAEHLDWYSALASHFAGLYGGPEKIDKAPLWKRLEWFDGALGGGVDALLADKPLTFAAQWALLQSGQTDSIPVQLDGTCNGLQHLSALLRDEEGAKHVNLTTVSSAVPPADIYGVVATEANRVLSTLGHEPWVQRFEAAGLTLTRGITKKPVMVLPYGGTREAVRLAVKAAVLEALSGSPAETIEGPWRSYDRDNYGAFRDRDLTDHPLFNQDAGLLSGLIWDAIAPVIPKAMGAMAALQAIGSWVGTRGLSWRVGVGPEEKRLWVTQAKSLAARKQVTMQGFHLPALVRRLSLNAHSNEVDPKAHRTGIVANFIHSQDAAHLAASLDRFRASGGGCVGAVHDCVMVRPSEAALMGRCLREAFVDLYTIDPLAQPVRLLRDKDTVDMEFPSWYEMGAAAGVTFPERGSYDIHEVEGSPWFFS